ncbi:hypothetical protein N7456_011996 [Penicillium angulare]|uniref:Xylanolytic transcriptional activator regulatory domain-containing protein n=1 Tax=Penicillium angulare TaxID=116970 RepID=A0A9W9K0L7_9EURO|nr:hypothetical protein N7456_011996 [Penicillium angulare]
MARVESLLEALIHRTTPNEIDALAPSSTPAAIGRSPPLLASLTEGILAQADISPTIKSESLRRQLTAMLLCQEDVDYLFASSHGWWLIQQHMMPYLQNSDEIDSRGLFNVSTVSKESAIVITRLLLCISICIQQLSSDVDIHKVQTTVPLRQTMSSIVSFIAQNVTSDDEITGSLEGVECLALQGIYEVNTGNLRRSWLSFRRAITVAQLLGLHRAPAKTSLENLDLQNARRSHIWYQISRAERYLSVMLGVPSSTGSAAFNLHNDDHSLSTADLYHKNLYQISGLILSRNQDDFTHCFSTTQRISEQLDSFAKQMSPDWWDIPMSLPYTRTKEASVEFERVMCQIWHFELEILLHLPFMIRAASDRRYEYSRISCLNASRNLIKRWIAIHDSHNTLLFSNLLEFQGFTAATTLLLGLLSFTTISGPIIAQEEHNDYQLIELVVRYFEGIKCDKTDKTDKSVSSQSISIIRTLQTFLRDKSISRNLCLEIPFFGTIKIARSCALQPLEGERLLGANGGRRGSSSQFDQQAPPPAEMRRSCVPTSALASHAGPTKAHALILGQTGSEGNVHFADDIDTSLQLYGCHFQPFEDSFIENEILTSEWPAQEMETILFDSLVDADLVGTWDAF